MADLEVWLKKKQELTEADRVVDGEILRCLEGELAKSMLCSLNEGDDTEGSRECIKSYVEQVKAAAEVLGVEPIELADKVLDQLRKLSEAAEE